MTDGDWLMYSELADWWPLLSSPSDYAEEAAYYTSMLRDHCHRPARTMLELGSGGGNNAFHLKSVFECLTLVDISPGMLAVSRALNPECVHHLGDMRFVRLGERFDCVFVHDAICYATSLDDLRLVVETAWIHCRSGGAVLLAPDFVRETFIGTTERGGHDEEGRGLRYIAWIWDPDPLDTTYVTDYTFLLRDRDGSTQIRGDRHVEGLFATDEWVEVLEETGFEPVVLSYAHSEVSHEMVVFVAVKR